MAGREGGALVLISWNTTNQCNLACDHCYRDAGPRLAEELSTEEGLALVEEVARAGFRVLILSGGEPLLRPDLLTLVAAARRRGLRPVLGTNGTLLTFELARKFKKAGLAAVGISLDSRHAAEHDRLRRRPGAWEAAVAAMDYCREAGLPFQVHTTVMDWNAAELEALTDFAVARGARGHHFFFLVPTGRAARLGGRLRAAAYEDLLGRILRKQQKVAIELKPTCAPQFMRLARQMALTLPYGRGCLAGLAYCLVNPRGEVQPCAYLDVSAGNVRATPFSRIWAQSPLFLDLRRQEYRGSCGRCAYRRVCGGCRARAYSASGDYLGEDPWCLYRGGEGKEEAHLAGHGCPG